MPPHDVVGSNGEAQGGQANGQAVEGELEFGPGEPGSQAVVPARTEGEGGLGQGGEQIVVVVGVAREGRRVSIGGDMVGRDVVTGADGHAAELDVPGGGEDMTGAFFAVAEGDQVEQAFGENGGGLFAGPSRVQAAGCSVNR